MTGQERKQLQQELNSYDNVGDMIKHLYTQYDCHKKTPTYLKSTIINGLISAVSLLSLEKYDK